MPDPEIIYLSGPMSGLPEYNHPTFHRVAAKLRSEGHLVMCPPENGLDTATEYLVHIKADIAMLLQANAIALLPGWPQSKGASLELYIARFLNYKTYIIDSHENLMPATFPPVLTPI